MSFFPLLLALDSLTRPLGGMPRGVTDGYASTVQGEQFTYQSAHPTAHASLLVRSVDSTRFARWLTAPVVGDAGSVRHIAFLAAMDVTDPGQTPVRFWMTVNGHRLALPQPTTSAAAWNVAGSDGIVLHFRRLMVDKYGDVHGIFTLDVPAPIAPNGKPVTLQVQGEDVGRQSWFIFYTVSVRPTIAAHNEQLLGQSSTGLRQFVRFDVWRPFDSTQLVVAARGVPADTARVGGGTRFWIEVPAVSRSTSTTLTVHGRAIAVAFRPFSIEPVVRREVYLINHAHLDIGYTALQPEVQAKHERTIDSALADISASSSNPPGERFLWNEEGLWPLQHYLATRPPADTARLLGAVRRGDDALSALYANLLTGLSGGEELIHLGDYARHLRRADGLPITMAMTSDVPGYTWGLVPALAQQGIRYLSSGPNESDRIGNILSALGDKPFWWMGPSGRDSLLVMFAGRGYSWVFNWPAGRITTADAEVMGDYMDSLAAHHYPWEIVQVRVAIGGDNGIPDGQLASVVQQWNARYASPRLVIATLPQMFDSMATRYGDRLPRVRGDLTGYWEDGAVSSLREEVMTREAAARLVEAQAVSALRRIPLPPASIDSAWADVLLWHEHTWGADASISNPDAPRTLAQWMYKQHFAIAADSASRDLESRALTPRPGMGGIAVWNTHNVLAREVVVLPESVDPGGTAWDDHGRPVPSQRLAAGGVAARLALPPLMGTWLYMSGMVPGAADSGVESAHAAGDSLWNGLVVVHVDRTTGAIASVRWHGRELVDSSRGGWGRYRYVAGFDTSRAQDARALRIDVVDSGPLVATLRVTANAPGAVSLVREITLNAGSAGVTLTTHLDKTSVRTNEAVHVSFPLAVPSGTIRMEQGWAVVRPDTDQATGANRNLYPVQHWLDASNADFGVTIVTPDLPLWELNGLTAEAFHRPDGRDAWLTHSLPGTELIAYAMNNYWHTNYKADQPGPVTFRVVLLPHGPFDAAEVTQAALAMTEPPMISSETVNAPTETRILLSDSLVVSSLAWTRDGYGQLLRLWNPGSAPVTSRILWRGDGTGRMWISSPGEERGIEIHGTITVPAMGVLTIRRE